MIIQIGNLGDNYTNWCNKPVDRPLRLFDTTALEMLTKTPWWLVPCIWIPIIGLITNIGIKNAHAMAYSNVSYFFQFNFILSSLSLILIFIIILIV